jgi:hypothetical protein
MTFPRVEFQGQTDSMIVATLALSSVEPHFCHPLMDTDPGWDAGTCASAAYTDKGHFSATATSLYPPRSDLTRDVSRNPSPDSADVELYAMLNPFDAVSQATPPGGLPRQISWAIPADLATGAYVMVVEVGKEFDDNASYNATSYPAPVGIPFGEYGEPYRGQPSVVYSVPFAIQAGEVIGVTQSYAGYGDPDGQDGVLRAPDGTITADTPGSGAARLQLVSDGQTMYRVRVDAHRESDHVSPGVPEALALVSSDAHSARLTFIAPGDDGSVGLVRGYDARILATTEMTEANFASAPAIGTTISPAVPGESQPFTVDGLLPETDYWVGIRALDSWLDAAGICHDSGPLAIYAFTTPTAPSAQVDACFIATAAYGSVLANDVGMLRRFRDAALRNNVLGELAVEAYYTFGPAIAGVIGESDLLRATTRDLLAPVVAWARDVRP